MARFVRFVPIVLQKSPSRLCEIEICNNRIGASVLLNRCCSFVPDLESMFRDQMQKILLQHNLPIGDTSATRIRRFVRTKRLGTLESRDRGNDYVTPNSIIAAGPARPSPP